MLCGTPVASPEAALLESLRRLGLRVGGTRALLLRSRLLERPGLRHLRLRVLRLGHLWSCVLLLRDPLLRGLLLRSWLLERPGLRHLRLRVLRLGHLRSCALLLRNLLLERPRLRHLLLSVLRPAKLLLRGRLERPGLRELLLLLHLRS